MNTATTETQSAMPTPPNVGAPWHTDTGERKTAKKSPISKKSAKKISEATTGTSQIIAKKPRKVIHDKPSKQNKAMIYEQRVRVGQQIFAVNQDLIVTQLISQGAELKSEGSIHAYAPMYGKVFAGTKGDKEARIYCTAFYGELVSIAGIYQLFETIDQRLLGKAVMFWLENDQLMVKPLSE